MKIIYHNKDLDGFCSGAIARKWAHQNKHKEIEMIGWDYGNPIPDHLEGHDVIMTDISFPVEFMIAVDRHANLTWIDHHKTAIDDSKKYGYKDINGSRLIGDSASLLAWKYFFPDLEVPEIVYWVDRYDVWKQDDPAPGCHPDPTKSWEQVLRKQYLLRHFFRDPSDRCEFNHWNLFLNQHKNLKSYESEGDAIYEYQIHQNELACKHAFELNFRGFDFLALNIAGASSTVVDSIIDPKYDGILFFNYSGKEWKISLRGNGKDLDMGAIARQYNGGGHKDAAGFTIDRIERILG